MTKNHYYSFYILSEEFDVSFEALYGVYNSAMNSTLAESISYASPDDIAINSVILFLEATKPNPKKKDAKSGLRSLALFAARTGDPTIKKVAQELEKTHPDVAMALHSGYHSQLMKAGGKTAPSKTRADLENIKKRIGFHTSGLDSVEKATKLSLENKKEQKAIAAENKKKKEEDKAVEEKKALNDKIAKSGGKLGKAGRPITSVKISATEKPNKNSPIAKIKIINEPKVEAKAQDKK